MAKKKKRCNARRNAVRAYRAQHPNAKYTLAHTLTAPRSSLLEDGWRHGPALLTCSLALAEVTTALCAASDDCLAAGAHSDVLQLSAGIDVVNWLAVVVMVEHTELLTRQSLQGWGIALAEAPERLPDNAPRGPLPDGPGPLTQTRLDPQIAELLEWPWTTLASVCPEHFDEVAIGAVSNLRDWARQNS